jgi:succinyl-CoA synthetase alpha subunit
MNDTAATATRSKVFPNLYKDSVTLMQLGATLRARDGVVEASCIMATPANLAQLAAAELTIATATSPSDLLVVVRGDAAACDDAITAAAAMLQAAGSSARGEASAFRLPLSSLALGLEEMPEADLALISVPGDYAAAEALKALKLGLHVLLFSDNVPIDEERAVKMYARDRGLLVMGPDCGTAIVNGVPLGFANVVRRGDIGLVAASGTGLQEVTCRIDRGGGGVSQALGTGGRDLKDEVGGITMLMGLRALADDPATRVIVLISKPPAPSIARSILDLAASAGKPVVVHFLGADPTLARAAGLYAADSLQHAADAAVAISLGRSPPAASAAPDASKAATIAGIAARLAPSQRAIRGLFTGGTFCYEAQLVFAQHGLPCVSNAPVQGAHASAPFPVGAHAFIDLGDDDYTRGRPHPMIDPSQRNAAVLAEAAAPATAAIVFDVVLGYGAHPDPAGALAEALHAARAASAGRTVAFIGHVCGTDGDPQGRDAQIRVLEAAGAIVAGSNYEAVTLAADLAQRAGRNGGARP